MSLSSTDALKADDDYKLYLTSLDTNDPMRMVAQAALGLSNSQADLLRVQTANVTKLTQKMSDINDLLAGLNRGLQNASESTSGNVEGVIVATDEFTEDDPAAAAAAKKAVMDMVQGLVANGATTQYTPPTDTSDAIFDTSNGDVQIAVNLAVKKVLVTSSPKKVFMYKLVANRTPLTNMSQALQRAVDQISSAVQQAQLDLQTLMGRYNGSFELVTTAIKKDETQAQTVNANIRK